MDAQTIAITIMGMVGAPIIQGLRSVFDVDGVASLWLALGVSFLAAFGALLFTGALPELGDLSDPVAFIGQIVQAFAAVFALSTVVYKHVRASGKWERSKKGA